MIDDPSTIAQDRLLIDDFNGIRPRIKDEH
jgi:hypothetical protein